MIFKFLFFVFGLMVIFSELLGSNSAPILILLYVVMEVISGSYNKTRNIWESFHRELELNESLGLPITKHIDILPLLSKKESENLDIDDSYGDSYFARNTESVLNSFNNILESSWWSKHLSQSMSKFYMAITICIGTISLIAIFYSIQHLTDSSDLQTAAKVVVSFIFMIFSMDFIKLWYGFYSFSVKSEKVESKSRDYIASNSVEVIDAYSLWVEYQFARAQAPLIPRFIWKYKQDSLNEIWQSPH
jgi:hypothetical protein